MRNPGDEALEAGELNCRLVCGRVNEGLADSLRFSDGIEVTAGGAEMLRDESGGEAIDDDGTGRLNAGAPIERLIV